MSRPLKIALVGNPNCGKTTIFNKLTTAKQKVGNWSGVTVEKISGYIPSLNSQLEIIDLPGIYSLSTNLQKSSIDQSITCQYLLGEDIDLIINVLDAANLKRNLYLTLQLLELGKPCIIVLNMWDIAKKKHLDINLKALEELLHCPVLSLVSNRNQGLEQLEYLLRSEAEKLIARAQPQLISASYWPQALQEFLQNLPINQQWQAIRTLEGGELISGSDPATYRGLSAISITKQDYEESIEILIADGRYQAINHIYQSTVQLKVKNQENLEHQLDKLLLHRYFAIPLFFLIMYLVFELAISLGGAIKPIFEQNAKILAFKASMFLGTNFAMGLSLGVSTVAGFIPQLGILFLCLAFLEDSGYMARAAFVMDRFMQFAGLPGKSFVPLIIGFGCNVPAIMSARTLESWRDRVITSLMTPFMSCGARLAIFIVFASIFFPQHSGLLVFILYVTGIFIALITGLILKYTLLKGNAAPNIFELPYYHLPTWYNLWQNSWQRLKSFCLRAGQIIIPFCIILSMLTTTNLEKVGKTITPIFKPLGITEENWPLAIGLVSGIVAKEVVVGTLNSLYSDAETSENLEQASIIPTFIASMRESLVNLTSLFKADKLNPLSANQNSTEITDSVSAKIFAAFTNSIAAFAYCLFILLYIPCLSTFATLAKELSMKWALISLGWSLTIAYFSSALVFLSSRWW